MWKYSKWSRKYLNRKILPLMLKLVLLPSGEHSRRYSRDVISVLMPNDAANNRDIVLHTYSTASVHNCVHTPMMCKGYTQAPHKLHSNSITVRALITVQCYGILSYNSANTYMQHLKAHIKGGWSCSYFGK